MDIGYTEVLNYNQQKDEINTYRPWSQSKKSICVKTAFPTPTIIKDIGR